MAGQIPIYNGNGLITGYQGQGPSAQGAGGMIPHYDVNGLITGYTNDSGTPRTPATQPSILNPTSPAAATGAGADPNKDFSLLNQVKSGPIAGAATGLLGDAGKAQATTNKTFDDYLNEFRTQAQNNKNILAQDQATLGDTTTLKNQLNTINTNFANAGNATNQQIIGANNNFQNSSSDILNQLQAENARYEAAAQNVANQAVNAGTMQNKMYQAASGTPGSNSGDMINRAIQTNLAVNIPLQQELSARRSALLTNVALPLAGQYRANTTGQLEGFQAPLNSQIAGMGTNAAQMVQSLKQALAGRSMQESQAYMNSLGIPIELQQQVLQGNIGAAQGLSTLDLGNTFYGLSNRYAPPGFSMPNYMAPPPNYNGFQPGGGGGRTGPFQNSGNVQSGPQAFDQNGQMISPGGVASNMPTYNQSNGNLYDQNGNIIRGPAQPAGYTQSGGNVYDRNGNWIGPSGAFQGQYPVNTMPPSAGGRYDDYGNVFDNSGNMNAGM